METRLSALVIAIVVGNAASIFLHKKSRGMCRENPFDRFPHWLQSGIGFVIPHRPARKIGPFAVAILCCAIFAAACIPLGGAYGSFVAEIFFLHRRVSLALLLLGNTFSCGIVMSNHLPHAPWIIVAAFATIPLVIKCIGWRYHHSAPPNML